MRHRDDDLEPFREDPIVQALTAPGSPAELAGQADAVAAYSAAAPVPPHRRRSAARVATGTTVAVVVLGVSGGVAAAYANYLPASLQQKLHDKVSSIPAPTKSTPAPVAVPTPTQFATTTPTYTPTHNAAGSSPPHSSQSPTPSATPATPPPTASVPVVVPSASVSATVSASATPTPTSTVAPPPVTAGQLGITVSPASRVTVGTQLAVTGTLTDANGNVVADRRVALIERVVGGSRQRLGVARTSAEGEVTFAVPAVQRTARLVLRSGRVHSPIQRVVVIPIIHVEVPPTAAGQTSVTVSVSVTGGQAGDVVVLRAAGARTASGTLDGALHTTFTVPVSQSQATHYRVVVQRTRAHAAHSLAFYVPPSGG